MIEDKKFKKILEENEVLSREKIEKFVKEAKKEKANLYDYIATNKLVPEELLFNLLASYFDLPLVDLKNETIRKDILFLIPEPIAQTHEIVAFDQTPDGVKVATTDPSDLQTVEFLKKKLGKDLILHLTTPKTIQEILKQYHQSLEAEFEDISKGEDEDKEDGKGLKELAQDLPIVRVVDTLLEYAIFEEASDIHIEPTEKDVVVRYRIDGILKDVMTLPKSIQSGLIARIKVLSNLKLD